MPPRSRNLRTGGGRKDNPGWTEQKRRSNRHRFDSLRPYIRTGVTISYPAKAEPEALKSLNECAREFCKEKRIPARSVWEGPRRHQHIALGIEYTEDIERAWKARLKKRWLKHFGVPLSQEAFLWKPEIAPNEIASYLSKTRAKDGVMNKGTWPWLCFNPVWEVGFQKLCPPQKRTSNRNAQAGDAKPHWKSKQAPEKQGEKSAPQYSLENGGHSSQNPGKQGANSEPRKTRGNVENDKEHMCETTLLCGELKIVCLFKLSAHPSVPNKANEIASY